MAPTGLTFVFGVKDKKEEDRGKEKSKDKDSSPMCVPFSGCGLINCKDSDNHNYIYLLCDASFRKATECPCAASN